MKNAYVSRSKSLKKQGQKFPLQRVVSDMLCASLSMPVIGIIFILMWNGLPGYAGELTVRYPTPESKEDQRYEYPMKLLELALSKTVGTYGGYSVRIVDHKANKARLGYFLKEGKHIDILWHAENGELEKDFIPIRIPLLKGLIGYRVFLIRKSDQAKFDKIKTLEELRQFTAGFGHSWADRKILEANGIPLDLTSKYELIFKKLNRGRFDYFPRGINEAWPELEARKHIYPEMAVENSILLFYQLPIYFIVNKNNSKLAERVEKGLREAAHDGSFDDIFLKYHHKIIDEANMNERTLIRLKNPDIPPETPEDEIFWFQPNGLR